MIKRVIEVRGMVVRSREVERMVSEIRHMQIPDMIAGRFQKTRIMISRVDFTPVARSVDQLLDYLVPSLNCVQEQATSPISQHIYKHNNQRLGPSPSLVD